MKVHAFSIRCVGLLCLLLGMMACSEENNCSMTGRPMLYIGFYSTSPTTQEVKKEPISQLTVTALGTQEVLINRMANVEQVALPLRYTEEQTTFVFHYNPDQLNQYTDTLVVTHKNTPFFQSLECGYSMKQYLLSATIKGTEEVGKPLAMERVEIKNREANTNEIQNLQLFYKAP